MKSLGLISLIFLSVSTVITVSELTSYFLGVSPKPIMRVNLVLGTGLVGVQLLLTALILKSISNLEKHIRN